MSNKPLCFFVIKLKKFNSYWNGRFFGRDTDIAYKWENWELAKEYLYKTWPTNEWNAEISRISY